MGNNSSKKGSREPCEKNLEHFFQSLSSEKRTVSLEQLREKWEPKLDPYLYSLYESYLCRNYGSEITKQAILQFFTGFCKADVDERATNLVHLLSSTDVVPKQDLTAFLSSILKSIFIIQKRKSLSNFKSWYDRTSKTVPNSTIMYGKYFISTIDKDNSKNGYSASDIASLFMELDVYLSIVFSELFNIESSEYNNLLLPMWKCTALDAGKQLDDVSVLDITQIMFINSELPSDYQNQWRLLYSSSIDGESFTRFASQIMNKGPTLIIVLDKNGYIFGGFAPVNWSMAPNFCGDSTSFLFTLHPEMKFFSPTGYNTNFQYINTGQQTLPNGLGMGGKLEYFGMFLSADFGIGYCSESCTTYANYKMMSKTKDFSVAHLEVWGVGLPQIPKEGVVERSVLNSNLEARAILEMAGKTNYSDGLRDKGNDE